MIIRDSARKGRAHMLSVKSRIFQNTAKKYMQVGTLPEPPHKRGSILDPFKPQVNQMMHDGIFNCVVILETLQQMGYTGGKTIIKDYVHVFRPLSTSRLCHGMKPDLESRPRWIGESASIWAQMANSTKFSFRHDSAGYSRTRYVEFTGTL